MDDESREFAFDFGTQGPEFDQASLTFDQQETGPQAVLHWLN
jgi:hypothetical protein